MDKKVKDRGISRGIAQQLTNITINEIWKCWDKAQRRQSSSDEYLSIVDLEKDNSLDGVVRLEFLQEQKSFNIKATVESNVTLVIGSFAEEEVMLLFSEAEQLMKEGI